MIGPFASDPLGTVSVRMVPIAKNLSANHNVTIVLPPYDNPKYSGKIQKFGGVTLYNVTLSKIPLLQYPLIAMRLVRAAFRTHPSVIHVFKPKGYSGLAAMLLIVMHYLHLGPPIVIDTDDLEGSEGYGSFYREHDLYSGFMTGFFDFQEKWITKHSDVCTVASRELERIIVDEFGVDSKRVYYIPNGVERTNHLNAKHQIEINGSDQKSILLYTRFREFDVERLVDIFKKVKSSVPAAQLVVVGRGSFGEETRLLDLAKKNEFSDSLSMIGWVERDKLQTILKLGDIAIYPFDDNLINRTKCPGKLIELLSIGKPVVAEAVGQVNEYIIDGKTGLLVPSGDNREFAERITKLLLDREFSRTLGEAAKNDVLSRFDWAGLSHEVEVCYDSVLPRRPQLVTI